MPRSTPLRRLLVALLLLAPAIPAAASVAPAQAAPQTVATTEALPSGRTSYQAITPDRLADTRNPAAGGYTWINSNTIRVQVAGRTNAQGEVIVPTNARAAVLNVVMTENTSAGYVTVYPAGTALPLAATVNTDRPYMEVGNMATVQLGVGGAVDVYMHVPTKVIIDVSGAYLPAASSTSAGRLITLPDGAARVFDSRESIGALPAGGTVTIDTSSAGVPDTASAVVVNITAVFSGLGYWTAYPVGANPNRTATINIDQFLQTRAAQAIVLLTEGSRSFNVFTYGGGQVVVDVAGWFTGDDDASDTSGQFIPTSPVRVLDTRSTNALPPWNGSTFETKVANSGFRAAAVAFNLTGVQSWDAGYVTAYPAGQARPFASNLNFSGPNQTVGNHAIARLGARGNEDWLGLFAQSGAHLVADVAGWYIGTPSNAIYGVPANPFYWPNPARRLIAPDAGINVPVATGSNLDYVANTGAAATYPWSINVATPGNMILFGHRTSHGGPFRYLNNMVPNRSTFSIIGSDGHWYNYRVTRVDIVGPTYNQVQARSVNQGLITAQLVACHPPGSTAYRIVVTGALFSVT